MANTDIATSTGTFAFTPNDLLAGVGPRITGDATSEFSRKYALRDGGDATTQMRAALNKAWRLAHSPKDLNTVYRESA